MKRLFGSLMVLALVTALLVLPFLANDFDVDWTEEEQAFLAEHPVIRLGIDPEFVPFEFINEQGEYAGIIADYLSLIEDRTGLQFEVALDLTWVEAYEKVLAGEIDALPAVGKTTEREQHLLFSEPYYFFKRVIVTQDQDTKISGIEDLHGLTVAVQRNSSHHSYLTYYPQINLSLYDSAEAALTAVATQTERVFLGNLATTNYFIRSHALTNLRYVAFEADKEQALHFAVRQDWPELVSVFNKALSLISDDERLAINNRWIGLSTDPDYGPVLRIVAIIGSVVALVLIVSFHWIAVLRREIRKRRQVQQDLERAKQAADEANEFKSTFVARMSHELRTPLNAITGMAYLLKKTNLSLTQRLYVDKITQASSGMMGIIDDILDYSKIEAGKIELDIRSFNLDQIIQNVVNIVLYKIQEQEIGFRLAKDPQIPTWFFGDSKRLEQILLNVLNNAAKFTSEGEVSLDIRLLAREKDTYHLTFTIKDTGIGMDEEQMHKLFDPFIQGDSSISRRFGGSGLGLSIAKHLLDLMGGTIQVFSTEHEGSTFIIDLPLVVDLNQEGNYIQALSGDPFKDVRTLVLERSGANMNVIESYLRSFGMRCELTTSPASAIRMLEAADGTFAKPFDLLIVDYETPEKGGFDFVDAIDQNVNIVQKPECIMLLPMMCVDLFDELSKHKIALGIGKPIIPSVLLNGILDIFNVRAVGATRVLEKAEDELVPLERHYTVLVVEDNKTNQFIAQSLLQQIGIEAILASDGQEGVELFKQYQDRISLVLMDLHMPVMNGYEAARSIRSLPSDVPMVAMTADVILGVKEECEANGIHHYLSKPFEPKHFLQMVQSLVLNYERAKKGETEILDEVAGLQSMGGNGELYKRVLLEYAKENQETPDKLSQAVADGRYADAAQLVHRIKSSSGSIGAKSLFTLATRLQNALDEKQDEEIRVLTKDFVHIMTKLLAEIATK